MAAAITAAYAEIPASYYQSLDGRQSNDLCKAIANLAAGHSVITYGDKSWKAFEKTDIRVINGRSCWYDMYSNNIVWLPAHDALNIEHSVPNSWWGGKSGSKEAYADLMHLYPSDQNANNQKKNNPIGEVENPRLHDNGLTKIGTPKQGLGGGAATVFEPADEFKGDFARAYFYIFTSYAGIDWTKGDKNGVRYMLDTNDRLLPWAAEMLLRWNEADPVDDRELTRNEEIYKLQGNRNPFIDYPQLANYIWGEKAQSTFSLSGESPAEAINRPEAPSISDAWMTGVNSYLVRWWDNRALNLSYSDGTLMLSVDGRDFFEPSTIEIDGAASATESHTYKAYVTTSVDGKALRSPITTITLTALAPDITDYTQARWEKVTGSLTDLDKGYYTILSSNTLHPMSIDGGTTSTKFMNEAGFARFDDDGLLTELQPQAALVKFEKQQDNKYSLQVCDTHGNPIGLWNCTEKNKMKLDQNTFTPATAALGENDEFIFTFTEHGSLQFNKSQPRFLNYSSNQTPIYLYRFKDLNGGSSEVTEIPDEQQWAVGIEGNHIIAPQGAEIYNLAGQKLNGRNLTPGIYIVKTPKRTLKIRL